MVDAHLLIDPADERRALLASAIPGLPGAVSRPMLANVEVLDALGLPTGDFAPIFGARFRRDEMLTALRRVADGGDARLSSTDGRIVFERSRMDADGSAVLEAGERGAHFPNVALLGSDVAARRAVLDRITAAGELDADALRRWRDLVEAGPLDDRPFLAFDGELSATPDARLRSIAQDMDEGSAGYSDLIPRDVDYYLRLLAVSSLPPSLGEFEDRWLAEAGGLDPPALCRLLRSAAPLSCMRGRLVARTSEWLEPADRASLVDDLAGMADPYSVACAFEVACHDLEQDGMRERADALLPRLLDRHGAVVQGGGAMLSTTMAIATATLARERTVAGLPLYARRLARLLHASHLVRALASSNVDLPDFSAKAARAYALLARFADLCDAAEGSVAQLQLVGADFVWGQVFRRASEAISAVPEDRRPGEWLKQGQEALTVEQDSPSNLFLFAPGPVDEFGSDQPDPAFALGSDVADDLVAYGPGSIKEKLRSDLLKLTIGCELEARDRARYAAALPAFLEDHPDGEFAHLAEVGLQLAAKWGEVEVADRIMASAMSRVRSGALRDAGAAVRLTLLAAASRRGRRDWLDQVAKIAGAVANAIPRGVEPSTLVRAFEVLRDHDPELGVRLAPAKASAMLAYDRLPRSAPERDRLSGGSAELPLPSRRRLRASWHEGVVTGRDPRAIGGAHGDRRVAGRPSHVEAGRCGPAGNRGP